MGCRSLRLSSWARNVPVAQRWCDVMREERRLGTRSSMVAAGGFLAVGALALILGVVFDAHVEVGDLTLLAAVLTYLVVGVLLVARRPSERIGWIFAGSASLMLVGASAANYWGGAIVEGEPMTVAQTAAVWVSAWYFPVAFAGITIFTFLLFPTGSPPTPRWAAVGWIAGVAVIGLAVLYSLDEKVCSASEAACLTGEAPTAQNPLGVLAHGTVEAVGGVFFLLESLAALAALASVVVRYRRSGGIERAQLKWFTFAAAMMILFLAVGSVLDLLDATVEQRTVPILAAALALIPVSVGIALFRYRLYDIDRIINRTLVYGFVVGLLAAVYTGAVVALQLVLPERNDLAVAASTLAVAALFNPLRRRVQRFVDRRFYRSRYDAQRVVEEFSARLRDEVDVETLTADWVGVVQETVQPESVAVWVRNSR